MIPRSTSREHLQANRNVFNVGWSLTNNEMLTLGWDANKIAKVVKKYKSSYPESEL